jgi:hypothetical protein
MYNSKLNYGLSVHQNIVWRRWTEMC